MDSTERKKMIRQGFDTVAPGYDHPSLSFFPETADRLVDYLQLQPDQHLLDVCCGTGMVSVRALQNLPQGHVTGVDLSEGMLAQARNKVEAIASDSRTATVEFQQMDMELLALDTLNRQQPFDVATCSFGLFFVEDMTKALANIAGLVADGGKLAITSFAGDAFSPFADMFLEHYEATGRQVPPLAWKRLATEALIREQFTAVGITDVDIHHEPIGYTMNNEQMWWDVVWNAGWRSLLMQMDVDEQQQFKKHHMATIARYVREEKPWFNTGVYIAIGRK